MLANVPMHKKVVIALWKKYMCWKIFPQAGVTSGVTVQLTVQSE
jgi:hypothetical protein